MQHGKLCIHIFSNILDVIDREIDQLAFDIKSLQGCDNLFICVGPNYSKSVTNINKMYNYFENDTRFHSLSYRDETRYTNSYSIQENAITVRPFKNYQRIFFVNNN